MALTLTESLKKIFQGAVEALKGSARRMFMAEVVNAMGPGGQRQAEQELGWNRGTIRKGQQELHDGPQADRFSDRGRKTTEERLPHLLEDMKEIVDGQSQTDPTFKTTRLYRRISVTEVREQLILKYGYRDDELPCDETLRLKLNALGYYPKKVQKSQPVKKIAETDAIFEEVKRVNTEADANDTVLRLSLDAKATVLLDRLSRGGYNRVVVKAYDHDFRPEEKVTPFGIFVPQHNDLYLFLATSRVTADFIVDCIEEVWEQLAPQFPQVHTLVLNQDNGPECQSRRTQFMKRITEFADASQVTIQLAYYPPYHSKYNPIERVWGVLENYWQGELLDCVETVVRFAQNMTYNRVHPVVKVVKNIYNTGVALPKKAMDALEKRLDRLPGLEKWFVRIVPVKV